MALGTALGEPRPARATSKERLPAFDRIPSSKWGRAADVPVRTGRSLGCGLHREHLGRSGITARWRCSSTSILPAQRKWSPASRPNTDWRRSSAPKPRAVWVATSAFKVGSGYRVAIPVAAYYTWHGTNLEGRGVEPQVTVPVSTDALRVGEDNQLARAKEEVARI